MNAVTIALAILAATSNAVSNLLQRKANLEETIDEALSVRLVWQLMHNGIWVVAIGTVTLSFALQAIALGTGTLAAVEPIIVLELPLTIVLASFTIGTPLRRSELAAIVTMTAGLALVLVGLDPRGVVHPHVSMLAWAIGLPATAAVVVVLVLAGRASTGAWRAVLFGAATGIEFGMTAALMKGVTTTFASGGIPAVLLSWNTYAMVGAGVLGLVLVQNALQAGRLVAAQPGITLLDPVTAVVWGVFAFHENVNGGPWCVAIGAGAAAMAVGAALLARSPVLQERDEEQQSSRDRARLPVHGSGSASRRSRNENRVPTVRGSPQR